MKRNTLALFLGVLAILCALPAVCPAKSDWSKVRTKNFVLMGDAGEKSLRRVGLELEQFREALKILFPRTNLEKPLPTVVYVFQSPDSFRQFKPRRNGKIQDQVGGYFFEGREHAVIALQQGSYSLNAYEIIFHEYQHYVLDNNFDDPPLWLNEGLAEFYSQFKINDDGRKIRLGIPIGRHLNVLNRKTLIPLKTLFAVNHRSKEYSEQGRVGVFYAQSWALVHYLMLGNEGKRSSQLMSFLSNLNGGGSIEDNFKKSFGIGYEEMEKELSNYIGKFTFPAVDYTLEKQLELEKDSVASPLSEAEAEFEQGKLLYQLREFEDAEKKFKKSLSLADDSAAAHAWYGSLLSIGRRYSEAEPHFAAARRLDSNNYLNEIFRAEFYHLQEKSMEAHEAYQKAIEINPKLYRNHSALGGFYVGQGRDEEAARSYNKALLLAPREPGIFYTSSIICLRLKRGTSAALQAQTYLRLQGWDEESSPYAALVAYFGWRADKKSVNAAAVLEAALARLDRSVWGYTIFRFLKREMTADELLKLADNNDKQTEARTYIGLDLAYDGKTAEAEPYLEWVRVNGNRSFIEYGFSTAELKRIREGGEATR